VGLLKRAMGAKGFPADGRIAAIAARQHGVVSVAQLQAVGLTRDAITHRARQGRLHRHHRGVYSVGTPALSWHGHWKAAVLAAGGSAVLSHRSAAALWELLEPVDGPVEITLPGRGGRRKQVGLRIRRSTSLLAMHRTRHLGIEVTTPARTIVDLRRLVEAPVLRRAIRRAEFLGLPLGDIETDHTRSELEAIFLRLCRHHGIPVPEVNVRVGAYLVDFLWREERVIAETDGFHAHRGRAAFSRDRARLVELRALGFEVLPFSYEQVVGRGSWVVAAVKRALSSAGPPS
jgi:very-short-patch-repair endonuclease